MKNLIFAIAFAILTAFSLDTSAKDDFLKKDKTSKKDKSWKRDKKKTIPIDGGLSIFLLAAGAIGVSALRKKKIS